MHQNKLVQKLVVRGATVSKRSNVPNVGIEVSPPRALLLETDITSLSNLWTDGCHCQLRSPPPARSPVISFDSISCSTSQQQHQQLNFAFIKPARLPSKYTSVITLITMDQDRIRLRLKMKGRRRRMALTNRMGIPEVEYNGTHQPMRDLGQPQPHQPRNNERQSQQVPPHDNNKPPTGPSEQGSEPQSAKMLILLQNGEQRLITFTLPKESCLLQDVLEQVNVPFTDDTHIQCMQNTNTEIDYFVAVGSTTRIEDIIENHPMFLRDKGNRSPSRVTSKPQGN